MEGGGIWRKQNLGLQKVPNNKHYFLISFIYHLLGEEQMELMDAAGHHITDVLTELAYFSYLSRRAPIRALTHYVRATYVPNE
jgi:hypothetical protein